MKKMFLGLLVAGVAFSASAFTNVSIFAQTFYHTASGYVLAGDLPSGTTCQQVSTYPCAVSIEDQNIPEEYPIQETTLDSTPYSQIGSSEGTYQ